jgi:hypothetical protein
MSNSAKACPFVARECLQEGCMAWRQKECRLILGRVGSSAFERQLMNAAPLMYRSLLDLVRIMEGASQDCSKCGPDLWNYAQQIRSSLLNELIQSELAEFVIRADDQSR